MNKLGMVFISCDLVVGLVVGCRFPTPQVLKEQVVVTVQVEKPVVVEKVVERVVTATLLPPTSTSLPIYTPSSTYTPLPTYTSSPTLRAIISEEVTPPALPALEEMASPVPPPEVTGLEPGGVKPGRLVKVGARGKNFFEPISALLVGPGNEVIPVSCQVISSTNLSCEIDLTGVLAQWTQRWVLHLTTPGGEAEYEFYLVHERS